MIKIKIEATDMALYMFELQGETDVLSKEDIALYQKYVEGEELTEQEEETVIEVEDVLKGLVVYNGITERLLADKEYAVELLDTVQDFINKIFEREELEEYWVSCGSVSDAMSNIEQLIAKKNELKEDELKESVGDFLEFISESITDFVEIDGVEII